MTNSENTRDVGTDITVNTLRRFRDLLREYHERRNTTASHLLVDLQDAIGEMCDTVGTLVKQAGLSEVTNYTDENGRVRGNFEVFNAVSLFGESGGADGTRIRPVAISAVSQAIGFHQARALQVQVKASVPEPTRRHEFDVFLSYASADSTEAQHLCDRLQEAGLCVYMAAKQMQGGDAFHEKLADALHRSRQVVVVVSPASLNSQWVLAEVGAAWVLGRRITPILHSTNEKDLPDLLKTRHAITLSQIGAFIDSIVRDKTTE